MPTFQDLAAWYTKNTTRRIPLLEQLSAEDLAKEVDYIGLRNDPAVAYLNIAIRHTVHHRGQLSTYMRGMGAAFPPSTEKVPMSLIRRWTEVPSCRRPHSDPLLFETGT